jgi:hypothetical protein
MPPVPKTVGGTDESLSWVDVVKTPSGFRNGPQYVDPHKLLVAETQVESDKMDEMCDSVNSFSLVSSPDSGTGSNMGLVLLPTMARRTWKRTNNRRGKV